MEPVHFVSQQGPLCGRPDALWCTILREAVTCPRCRARLRALGADGAHEPPRGPASASTAR